MLHDLAGEQPVDDFDRFDETFEPGRRFRPVFADDVLVQRLAGAKPRKNRPGNIASSVAAACASTAGWYLYPGGVTPVPNRRLVVAPSAPIHDQTKAECPCDGTQGWKWSEAVTTENPFRSASWHHSSSR